MEDRVKGIRCMIWCTILFRFHCTRPTYLSPTLYKKARTALTDRCIVIITHHYDYHHSSYTYPFTRTEEITFWTWTIFNLLQSTSYKGFTPVTEAVAFRKRFKKANVVNRNTGYLLCCPVE